MNAAYLLMTTVWLAGADAAAPAPAPAYTAAPIVQGSCNGCNSCADSCDDCGKPGLFDRLRGLFRRKGNDCCDTCSQPSCDSCDSCERPGLFDRLRGLFRKNNDCCDSCAPSCCDGVSGPAVGGPETIGPPKEQPKKLPMGDATKTSAIGNSLDLAPITNR